MSKMKELYEKVAADSTLQAKFAEIMNDAEKAGKVETEKKLVAFAKETGYEVTVEEMDDFFNKLETEEGPLSEEELDAVAGGEGYPGGNAYHAAISRLMPFLCNTHTM